MSDQPIPPAPGANGGANIATGPVVLNLQFTKDLSFEVPGAPQIFLTLREAPQIDIALDVQARRLQEGQDTFEISLNIRADAKAAGQTAFIAELVYCGIFTLNGVPAEMMEPILLVECPRLLFPFARNILADVTRDGGFPPVLLAPIDFVQLWQQRRGQPSGAPVANA
ncbi:protein-export chaperone SecB [Roseomonas sp. JC162]|uniref:Protein-export protein SecB n=1 Tax=Neoroseomonas marina TaxID=1232220 RepID=A0A848E920_9PROT|nr:protein-export chaperone SecB [Neoroseomonas marina]NMJ40951.1 protein-export chaperone SecB [Neoroseomonas marina]